MVSSANSPRHVGVGHAAALSSGTAAIHLALLLLGVKPGDTVFCSSLTFVGSCNPISVLQCAACVHRLRAADLEHVCPAALERALEWARRENRLPRCVIVVNLYGRAPTWTHCCRCASATACPSSRMPRSRWVRATKGAPAARFGRLGVYSFNGNKIITTSGGGMLVADDRRSHCARASCPPRRAKPRALRTCGTGFNYRMSNVLAGIGRGQLRVLEQRVDQRQRV
jgi:dTDP-4-amino-4,6-dideoxygalactose transaminase